MLGDFKNISEKNSLLHALDGRVKTIVFLSAIIVAACLTKWYLVVGIWIASLAIFPSLHIPIGALIKRLLMPFSIAWLVFLSLIFTNGTHAIFVIHIGKIYIPGYYEGLKLGFLILLRIMTAVTIGSLLSFTTPMIEILETLRLCKVPNTIIDLAAMMYHYVFVLEETAHSMHRAQVSRMSDNTSWFSRAKDAGNVAGHVLIKSLDRSVKIYNAMLSRGYDENSTSSDFYVDAVPFSHIIYGVLCGIILVVLVLINIFI
ncbi:cobalt ECF transporter T component CbiQ [Clostridium pasteurianum]|uniref:Cobalt ABC transporter, permease protein CbiQ n=1 Tax=Clostridium pasteurianum BC1 TaxID=86416 RepID=R4JZR5_CLOPA|nr:cobalt ECF transporter T component CbiQ [Clostridium pasteurianum]AGK95808.1 cobalt ABC transporter, permease protein CbiQ [Clostridium pasteurianum BC1]